MAHECPDCDRVCHCNGDIEDCLMNEKEDVMACVHFKECQVEPNEDEELYDD